MKRVELLEEIVKKQEKQIRLLTDFIKLVDESETIKNSFLPYCSIKDKLRRNNIEITDLKSQLSEAGEENKSSHELQNERMRGVAGKSFAPHKHLDKVIGEVHVQEAFVLMKGRAYIRIFDLDDSFVGDYPMCEGDVSLLLAGGHSLILDEDSIFYEFKTRPYEGPANDKVFINE